MWFTMSPRQDPIPVNFQPGLGFSKRERSRRNDRMGSSSLDDDTSLIVPLTALTRRDFVIGTVVGAATGQMAAAEDKPSSQRFLPDSDWPMYRRDPALSAESPIRGGLAQPPRVAWTFE